eukprot:jgi/Galph1/5246/GphlegSOOS_G3823.1
MFRHYRHKIVLDDDLRSSTCSLCCLTGTVAVPLRRVPFSRTVTLFSAVILFILFAAVWRWRKMRIRKLMIRNRPSAVEIGPAIANFYDARSALWETLWGEHMHHGFYGVDGKEKKERIQAQEDMIEQLWSFAELDNCLIRTNEYNDATSVNGVHILDIGCGIGGSARYLAKKDKRIRITGITLSSSQVERGKKLNEEQNLQSQIQLLIADAHHLPFPDNCFDIIWSLESGEHMADKYLFLSECSRVLKPNGKLAMLVWCHRKCPPPLDDEERVILYSIYEAYRLPYVCSIEELANVLYQTDMTDITKDDWSSSVFPFWMEVLQTAFSIEAISQLCRSDWDTIRSVFAIRHMLAAMRRKLLVLGALRGTKKALVTENIR